MKKNSNAIVYMKAWKKPSKTLVSNLFIQVYCAVLTIINQSLYLYVLHHSPCTTEFVAKSSRTSYVACVESLRTNTLLESYKVISRPPYSVSKMLTKTRWKLFFKISDRKLYLMQSKSSWHTWLWKDIQTTSKQMFIFLQRFTGSQIAKLYRTNPERYLGTEVSNYFLIFFNCCS